MQNFVKEFYQMISLSKQIQDYLESLICNAKSDPKGLFKKLYDYFGSGPKQNPNDFFTIFGIRARKPLEPHDDQSLTD